jgi:hypothetical protein
LFEIVDDEDPTALRKRSKSKSNLFSLDKPMPTPRNFTPQFEIDFNEIILEHKISEGGYGIIYKGRWKETTVAIKMLKIEGASESHVRDFLCKLALYFIIIIIFFLSYKFKIYSKS